MEYFLDLTNNNHAMITAIATAVIAVAAVVTAVLTFSLIRENWLLRKAGTEPLVVAYLTLNSRYPTMVNLVLANIGQGAARNVCFQFDADEQDFSYHGVKVSNNVERRPTGTLPQGEKIEMFFGRGPELFKNQKLKPFNIISNYEDIKGRVHNSRSLLDVSQFEGISMLGRPAEHEVAEALKKIERHIGGVVSGFNRFKVEVITADDLNKELDDWRNEVYDTSQDEK